MVAFVTGHALLRVVNENCADGLLPRRPIDHIALPLAWKERVSIAAAWPASKGVLSDHSGLVVAVSDPATKAVSGE